MWRPLTTKEGRLPLAPPKYAIRSIISISMICASYNDEHRTRFSGHILFKSPIAKKGRNMQQYYSDAPIEHSNITDLADNKIRDSFIGWLHLQFQDNPENYQIRFPYTKISETESAIQMI